MAALDSRTEGWIAGLQLAALSMKGNRNVGAFIRAFAGDHRYIVDYLVEEVLKRQPQTIRSFLLQTSILDRLNGSLCDAITGQADGKDRLAALQQGNFFLVSLDDRRHWYRYHPLFADVLRAHLLAEQPDLLPILHRRASEWYEQDGLAPEAIQHALAARDFERAAILIELALPMTRQTRQEAMMLSWFQALPTELFQERPVLALHFVGTLMQNGRVEEGEAHLRDVERWLDGDAQAQPIYVDKEEFQRLPGLVAMYHAGIALMQGDAVGALRHARRVLDLAQPDDNFIRGASSALLGLASWASGDLDTGQRLFGEGMAYLQKAGFISDVIGGSITLADILLAQGHMREARGNYERGLKLAYPADGPPLRGAADMHVGLSDIYREQNELDVAAQHLQRSQELGELNGLPKNPYRQRVAQARLLAAQGDCGGALDLLDEAERLYESDFSPNFQPVAALRARVWIAAGRLSEALGWAREQGLSAEDELSYLREFDHITLARLLMAQATSGGPDSSLGDALSLLERLRQAAEAGGRMGSAIEIMALQALACQLQGDAPAARGHLRRALVLAEPEGYARVFLDEGPRMAHLISEVAGEGTLPAYTARLLAAFDGSQPGPTAEGKYPAARASLLPTEPLSQRELDILRLFNTELSGPEIAQELVIALSTVRTHTKSIYSKLDVNSRRAAVNRAIELGII